MVRLWGAILCFVLLFASQAEAADRSVVILHLLTSTSALQKDGRATLMPLARLTLRTPEEAQLDPARLASCAEQTRLICWVHASRAADAAYFLLLSARGGEDPRVTATLIDIPKALRIYHDAPQDAEDWAESVEDQVFQSAVHSVTYDGPLQPAQRFFRYLWEQLKPTLHEQGYWRPTGTLTIESEVAGLSIALDTEALGETRAGATVLEEIKIGGHVLQLTDPKERFTIDPLEVEVRTGSDTTVEPVLVPVYHTSRTVRQVTFWSGAVLATVGVVVTSYALFGSRSNVQLEPCQGGGCATAGSAFASSSDFSDGSQPGDGGLLLAPMGYSLFATGAVWSLGTLLFGGDRDLPWWQVTAGVLVGALSYGLSAALSD